MTAYPQTNHQTSEDRAGGSCPSAYFAIPGRVLMSSIFLLSGFMKVVGFSGMAGYMASKGMPAPKLMLALAAAAEIVGGLALFLGFLTRLGAFGLFVYLIPTTLIFHNFWAISDSMAHQDQLAHFLKNIAIMGGLLMVAGFGAGPLSVDAARRSGTSGAR